MLDLLLSGSRDDETVRYARVTFKQMNIEEIEDRLKLEIFSCDEDEFVRGIAEAIHKLVNQND